LETRLISLTFSLYGVQNPEK
jgi:hypothetical protein